MDKIARRLVTCLILISIVMSISAQPVEAARYRLNYTYMTLTGGYKLRLYVTGTRKKVKWSSSNKKIANVSSKGTVKGLRKGKCYVYAKVGGKRLKCRVTVTSSKPGIDNTNFTSRILNMSSVKINIHRVGFNKNGKPYISNKKGYFRLKLLNNSKKVKWYSSDKSIATVSKGVVRANKVGKCTVTAKVGSKKYKCSVTVTDLKYEKHVEAQEMQYNLISLVNKERVKNRVRPLKVKSSLIKAANIRVLEILPEKYTHTSNNDMVTDEKFSHYRPNNTLYSTVYSEVGLTSGIEYGENLGYTIDRITNLNEFAKESYNIFMKSVAHRENMLSPEYDYIGIGYVRPYTYTSDNGATYTVAFWAQEFYTI